MEAGITVNTPRFLTVRIGEVFESVKEANDVGFDEPTYYDSPDWEVLGKVVGTNIMRFVAARKGAI